MIFKVLQTQEDYIYLFLRIISGMIILPYGMQKLFGCFNDLGGGVGIKESIIRMRKKKIPLSITWLIIVGQSIVSIALLIGCFGRIAAGANFVIFTGALT